MIIVRLSGGLGNQLFQYSCGRSVALDLKDRLKLDISSYSQKSDTQRHFSLNKFNIYADIATDFEISKYRFVKTNLFLSGIYIINRFFNSTNYVTENSTIIDHKIKSVAKELYLDGFWQDEKYFKKYRNILLKEITFKNIPSSYFCELRREMMSTNSVSVHVRRTDYLSSLKNSTIYISLGSDYYYRAVKKLKNRKGLRFYIFSDDIEWAKNELKLPGNMTFVSDIIHESPEEEMLLMSFCKNNIIANSTFSWWGAWLNKNINKSIIAPSKWYKNHQPVINNPIPKSWLTVKP